MIKATEYQLSILADLKLGARIQAIKATGDWLCCLPNGMAYRVRKPTMDKLYREQKVRQDVDFSYVISGAGLAALTAGNVTSQKRGEE